MVGQVNDGWAVAMTLLGYERGEAAATFPIMFRTELDRLTALAVESGRADDPLVRQRLAWCHSKVEIMRYLGMRTLTQFLAGGHPGPDASIFKLYWSEYHRKVTELAVDILGAEAMIPVGSGAVELVPGRRRRRAERQRLVGGHVLRGPRRHDLRRHVAGAAQHPRRDGARAAEGARRRPRARGESNSAPTRDEPPAGCSACGAGACSSTRRCGRRRCTRSGCWPDPGGGGDAPVAAAARSRLPPVPVADGVRRRRARARRPPTS